MTITGLGSYRREVRDTQPCPDCGAEKGEQCRKIDPKGRLGDPITYVHDSRSFEHFQDASWDLVTDIQRRDSEDG